MKMFMRSLSSIIGKRSKFDNSINSCEPRLKIAKTFKILPLTITYVPIYGVFQTLVLTTHSISRHYHYFQSNVATRRLESVQGIR